MVPVPATRSLQTLMAGLIDYAGLFPPAQLPMTPAVQNYAGYRRSRDRWALGRFIVPATRLDEFAAAFEQLPQVDEAWYLSALLGEAGPDLERLAAFARRPWRDERPAPIIDTVELKAAPPEPTTSPTVMGQAVDTALAAIPPGVTAYVELPILSEGELDELLRCVTAGGGRAKVRTGGVTPGQFPEPAALLRFISACVRADVPFKATAGLHHPLRGNYRLTYEPNSALGTMFGFLNVFLAAAGLRTGLDEARSLELLTESDPASLRWDDDGVTWRDHRIDTPTLAEVRRSTAIAFGSCSFDEPIGDLRALGLLA